MKKNIMLSFIVNKNILYLNLIPKPGKDALFKKIYKCLFCVYSEKAFEKTLMERQFYW